MKTIFYVLLSLALLGNAQAATPTVTVTVSDYTLDHLAADRVVSLAPQSGGGAVQRREVSDANGVATFSDLTPGRYSLTIASVGVPTVTILVPNQSGTLASIDLVESAFTRPGPRPPSQDLIRYFRGLNYLWPSNHVTDGVLANDGSGGLLWSSTAGGGGASGPWTRATNIATTYLVNEAGTVFIDDTTGTIMVGSNAPALFELDAGVEALAASRNTSLGEPDGAQVYLNVNDGGDFYGEAVLESASNIASLGLTTGDDTNSAAAYLTTDALGQAALLFRINSRNMTSLDPAFANNLGGYLFNTRTNTPSGKLLLDVQENSVSKLSLTSNGVLSTSSLVLAGTTNQIVFGATNIAPVSAVAPTHWISVQVSGNSSVFRLPLYQ